MAALSGGKYLSLIDADISNLWSLNFSSHLETLNLHGNQIQTISNLGHLRRLEHLDLSANQIGLIENLDSLTSLKTLNLSCNLITSVEGLSSLRSLERLDLSYNQITDIHGVSHCVKLKYLNLNGNRLSDVNSLIRDLSQCKSLTHLVLAQDGGCNPLCMNRDYEVKIRQGLSQIATINDTDVSGNVVDANLGNIPGLESFLDFLLASDDTSKSSADTVAVSNLAPLLTPKIDAVMEQFKQRYVKGDENSSNSNSQDLLSSSNPEASHNTDDKNPNASRRSFSKSPSGRGTKQQPERRYNKSNYSCSSAEEDEEPVRDRVAHNRRPLTVSSSRDKRVTLADSPSYKGVSNTSSKEQRKMRDTNRRTMGRQQPKKGTKMIPSVTKKSSATSALLSASASDEDREKLRAMKDLDSRCRQEVAKDYKDLLASLQTERERRLKAEQAACKMADILKQVHAKHKASEDMKTSAIEATSQLKQAVLNEHETCQRLNHEVSRLQVELDTSKEKLSEALRDLERSRESLKISQSALAQKDGEEVVEKAHQSKKLLEANQKATAMTREAELLRHALDASKVKVEQLQETLASREQQHREDMKNRYSLNSPELQEVIGSKVKQVERHQQGELVRQQERLEQLSRQYTDLENEFRQALTMEEARFKQLRQELDVASSENLDNKQLLLAAQRKDETSTNIIAELSALVKEQKGRITELAKAKQEISISHKERVEKLEELLEDSRRHISQLESAKQAKTKLQATVQAQESVIEGLKAERKLWGQELAQQGASLAQDRGRLESRIETFTSEIAVLKKQLERETDSVKIKTKMIEDQTETIRKLKEAVVERDATIKKTRDECLDSQKDLETQVSELKVTLEDTQDLLDRSSARKEELKQKVGDLQQELEESRNTHSTLSARWKDKSELIGRLEQQVTQMRNNWSQKEAKMAAERDMAFKQAKQAVDKLKSADQAFRQQLDVKESACKEKICALEEEKQQEVELANKKVALVEEEMRDLLRENEANKRAMEVKMKKLTQALGDLQTDLL